MPWTYHQKSGAWHDPHGTLMHYGYSGHGDGVNNPALESKPNVGPIPRGLWQIQPAFDHPKLGPVAMRLTMQRGNTYGRTAFLIHGDNAARNRTASEGCIIPPRLIREAVAASQDRGLLVVE